MASLADLASMKLAAVAQRGSKKDFIDVWALADHGFSLERMLAFYQQKYDTEDISHLVTSLSYFDDADPEPMPSMFVEIEWSAVKAELRRRVKAFAD
ncbi:MAG: nucleotidyl transferase AbiEii/AbiGii toxin family protein [Persicimonas sp.]